MGRARRRNGKRKKKRRRRKRKIVRGNVVFGCKNTGIMIFILSDDDDESNAGNIQE